MRRTRPVAALAVLAAVTALATGCQEDQQQGASGSSGGSDTSGGSGGGDHQSPHTSVDGDAGKTLTPGTSTRVRFQRASDKNVLLDVSADKVRKGSRTELKDVSLTPEERVMQPYYVTMTYRNAGKKKGTYVETPTGLKLQGGGKANKQPTVFRDEVKRCPHKGDSMLAPGKKLTTCTVVLAPAGKSVEGVQYEMNMDKQPVFWKAKP